MAEHVCVGDDCVSEAWRILLGFNWRTCSNPGTELYQESRGPWVPRAWL